MRYVMTLHDLLDEMNDLLCVYRTLQRAVLNDFTEELECVRDFDVALYRANVKLEKVLHECQKALRPSK